MSAVCSVAHSKLQGHSFCKEMLKAEISNRLSISKPGMIKLICKNTFFPMWGNFLPLNVNLMFVTQLFYNNYNS